MKKRGGSANAGKSTRERTTRNTGRPGSRAPTYVVGVGGSAGSLEPLESFFGALRPHSTMSFVVATHRDPHEKGLLVDILTRATSMRVWRR